MADPTITDAVKQTVITRLATINSATSILSLINGRPAKVTTDEVLDLAARIERWAWRDLLSEQPDTRASEKPTPRTEPAKAKPEPAAAKDNRPRPNGDGQHVSEASVKQINAIFAIGRSKGYDADDLKAEIKAKLGKSVDALTGREASTLIDDLKAL